MQLSTSYPTLRLFVAACHARGAYALGLIVSHAYRLHADGSVTLTGV